MRVHPAIFALAAAINMGAILSHAALASPEPASIKFAAGKGGEFVFNTGTLRGKLRAGGRSVGLSDVVHVPTGMRIDASMGLFSHYRLFSSNKRYGTAGWDLPSRATLTEEGSVEVRWPSAADRPFELSAVYRWAAPNVLDLETSVVAKTNLPNFESFLASYFTASFTNAAAYVARAEGPGFVSAERSAGIWLAFPRDDQATAIIRDGRWKIEPNPVDWVIMPPLNKNLGYRRSPATGLAVALMSPPGDCFAVLCPFQTESHYSMYLSLFGRDIPSGQTARARARLLLAVAPSEGELAKAYDDYQRR